MLYFSSTQSRVAWPRAGHPLRNANRISLLKSDSYLFRRFQSYKQLLVKDAFVCYLVVPDFAEHVLFAVQDYPVEI